MSRPNGLVARQRRDEFARLCAETLRDDGLEGLHANVKYFAKSCHLDPWRVVRLLVEPEFNAQVERMVGFKGDT